MKTLVTMAFLCLIPFLGQAQRYYGQWTVSGGGGYGNDGWHFHVSGEKYIGRTLSAVKASFKFARHPQTFDDWKIPINRYTLNLSYFYSLERYMSSKIFVNAGGGVFIGSEDFRRIQLPYGVVQVEGNKFCTGLFIYPQLEFIFKEGCNIVGYFEPQIAYDFLARVNRFQYSASIGVKYYF